MSEPTILIVDDNDAGRYATGRTLKLAGFTILEATSGEAALRAIAEKNPSLVLLDVNLPDMKGFEVCRRLKADERTAAIPVLMMSASFVRGSDHVRGLEWGADGYLTEPIEPEVMTATINALLRVRNAEDAVRLAAHQWQTTFDAIGGGVALLDAAGRLQRCNRTMKGIIEGAGDRAVGMSFEEIIRTIADTPEAVPAGTLTSGPGRTQIDAPIGGKWYQICIDPLVDEAAGLSGAVCTMSDVSDRRRADEALRDTQERHRLLMENVKDYAIIFMDTEGRISSWNLGATRILGYEESEILGADSSIIFVPEDIEAAAPERELGRATTEGRADDERWHIRKDGTRFWGSGVVTPLRDDSGRLQGFAKVLRDDTQRKHAEEERAILLEREQAARVEAENANNAKDQFLAVLSHELRTPLTPVMALAQILENEEGMPEDLRPIVTIISRNIELEARLIDDLLDLTRISRNKLQLHFQTVDAHAVLHDVIETCRGEIEEKSLTITLNLDATRHHVKADPARMQQIFWNLLKNATKFTPVGGEVTIHSANRTEGLLEIGVSDTGIGIEEGLLSRIFESFDQGNYEIARKFGGLGLGLSISRSLVERQGGTLTASSGGIGSGASFVVELETVPMEGESGI